MSERREKYMSPTQIPFRDYPPIVDLLVLKESKSITGHVTLATAIALEVSLLTEGGTLVLKCDPKHGKDEFIPFVFSYIPPFVHSYNANYTIRLTALV